MTGTVIDGKAIAATIRGELKVEVDGLSAKYDKKPGLGVILVGERKDSQTYVRMKKRACAEVGIESVGFDLPDDVTEAEILEKVDLLNQDDNVHGILVQLPLPAHINEKTVLDRILVKKDVDGLHPLNVAAVCRSRVSDDDMYNVPCTPQGCIELLDRSGVKIEGANAVVLGRSSIVGIPVAMLLMQRNATVTICHSRTVDIADVVRRADIVIAAVGRAEMVQGDWIKPGAAVIDVGINSLPDASKKAGYRLVGDVNYAQARETAGAITPVPGGVGPMTIAMLLKNTVKSAGRVFAEAQAPPPAPAAK